MKVRVTVEINVEPEDGEDIHPSYLGRVIDSGLTTISKTNNRIASWQITETEELK